MHRFSPRRLLHPYSVFGFLPAHVFSPLDALAERIGIERTEAFFAANPQMRCLAAAIGRYLGDSAQAERLLKKDFHVEYERRLRTVALTLDPPEDHRNDSLVLPVLGHPLDQAARDDLAAATRQTLPPLPDRRPAPALGWISLAAWSIALPSMALFLLLRFGRRRVHPWETLCASPSYGSEGHWQPLAEACAERGVSFADTMLFVIEDPSCFCPKTWQFIEAKTLPVPIGYWLREAFLPLFPLIFTVWRAGLGAPRNAPLLELGRRTLCLAGTSLNIRRLACNIRGRFFLDTAEESSTHILKSILLGRSGIRLVRWPRAQVESPGHYYSYVSHDIFLSGGRYHAREYAQSWRPDCVNVPIGQVRNDRIWNRGERVRDDYRQDIEARLARGQRMAVLFTGNEGLGFDRPSVDLATTVWRGLRERNDWFLVIKPKFNSAFYRLIERVPGLRDMLDAPNVLCLRYERKGEEVCPSGWLIPRMSLGFSVPGSIQLEALALGKSLMVYFPVLQRTRFKDFMRKHGLLFDDCDALTEKLKKTLDRPEDLSCPIEWIKNEFDPFADDRALDRAAEILFSPDGAAARLSSAIRRS